jgi:hypothetical protein
MAYKLLGFVVWKGAKWYLRKRLGVVGSRPALAAGAVAVGIGIAAARGSRRSSA